MKFIICVIIILEFFYCRILDNDIDNAIIYSVIFLNTVNKHFRDLENPKINLSFAGLLIGTVSIRSKRLQLLLSPHRQFY